MIGSQKPLHFLLKNTKVNEINISKYKIGHMIPNTQLGGLQGALFNVSYQLFIYVFKRKSCGYIKLNGDY